ncbi:antitoxin [Corynebacterium callunae]|uniref:antitoxin n=1 Tax=Corynebacterium callunae TaxID=1721 RepID=UPI0039825BE6
MGIFDSAKDKAAEFLNSEAGEEKSDQLLDKVAEAAAGRFGEDKAEQINRVRDMADDRIGTTEDPAN